MNAKDTNILANDIRVQSTNLLTTLNNLRATQGKWNALDLTNALVESDISGDNEGITTLDLSAVVFDTLNAFDAVLAEGHATNLHNVAVV